jgi:chemotaxis protein CheC
MDSQDSLKKLERDALGEIANVGAGNAATAVSQLIGATLTVSVPRVSLIGVQDLPEPLGGPETVVAGIYFRIFGEAPGKMLLCLPLKSVDALLELMLGAPAIPGRALNEIQQSAVKELGNILCSAYLNALARFMDMQLLPSVPALAVDMVSSILSTVMAETAQSQAQALLIETEFSNQKKPLAIHLFLVPEAGSLDAMLQALRSSTGINPSA